MYRHLTTCEPPRPSLGRRVDLSDYSDPNFPKNLPQPGSPISTSQTPAPSSSPSSSLPPVLLSEPIILTNQSIITSQNTVEISSSAPPVGRWFELFFFLLVSTLGGRGCVSLNSGKRSHSSGGGGAGRVADGQTEESAQTETLPGRRRRRDGQEALGAREEHQVQEGREGGFPGAALQVSALQVSRV